MSKMNGSEIKEMQVKYNLQSWSKQKGINPIPIEKADGIYMWDFDGNRYSDMSSQLVNLNVGHNCRPIIEAIKEQLNTGFTGTTVTHTFAPAQLTYWKGYDGTGVPEGILDQTRNRLYL